MARASGGDQEGLQDVVVANLHGRFTGVSRTVAELVPRQRARRGVTLIDKGALGLGGTMPLWRVFLGGFARPKAGRYRIFHARRDVEMLAGIALRAVPMQRWQLVFTSDAPKPPNRFMRFLLGRMDAVVATSEKVAGFLPWHYAIVPHGIDTEAFRPAAVRAPLLDEVGLSGKLVIGAFGRIRPSKGTDVLIEALLRVLPEHRDVVCVITGLVQTRDQAFFDALSSRIAGAGLTDRIRFLGDLEGPEIRRWYQRISLCVAASRSEGFGLTPFEAFASGAAAITSEAGVWPQMIPRHIGWVTPTEDAGALAGALLEALGDRPALEARGIEARKLAVAQFSIEAEAEGLEAIYGALQSGETLPRRT